MSIKVAVRQVKDSFASNVAAGGGGRGGSASAVLNRASKGAEMMASVFADYFTEIDPSFDVDAFFRECCLRETFIEHMAKARQKHRERQLDTAWHKALRRVKK